MSNLRPEKRLDKNGVLTTKWVRSSGDGGTATSIPAPTFPAAKSSEWYDLHASRFNTVFEGSRLFEDADFTLEDLDLNAVHAANKILDEAPSGKYTAASNSLMRTFRKMYRRLQDLVEDDGDYQVSVATGAVHAHEAFRPLSNFAVFGDLVLADESKAHDVAPYVSGLEAQFGPDRDFLYDASDEERKIAVALVTVATRIDDKFITVGDSDEPLNDPMSITSPELTEFIMNNPDDAASIAKVINERDTDDLELVMSVLKYDQQALRDGLL